MRDGCEVVMPQMGESIEEATITKWLVELGDRVERDQPLFEISTDKVDAEVPSPASGVLRKILHPVGTTVPVNTPVAWISYSAGPILSVEQPGASHPEPLDADLERMSRDQLIAEVKRLRQGIREHRDSTGQELCWHHPALWSLLPERTDPLPVVPDWPQFLRGCILYRQSLDEQIPQAPRSDEPYRE